jgi:hypothetical protein
LSVNSSSAGTAAFSPSTTMLSTQALLTRANFQLRMLSAV